MSWGKFIATVGLFGAYRTQVCFPVFHGIIPEDVPRT